MSVHRRIRRDAWALAWVANGWHIWCSCRPWRYCRVWGVQARLTYHEAFVAQGAREILNSGNWAYPTIGGLPWLEKPPLPWWLVAACGSLHG